MPDSSISNPNHRTSYTLRGLVLGFSLVLALPSAGRAAPRAGVAAAVRGEVQLSRAGAVGTDLETGAPIHIDDEIVTGADSGLQILLLDETVFTVGPNSKMKIDRFVFDPSSNEGELDAELVRGAFRFISGRIAKQNPDKMNVKLPSGTIGIRGTMVDTRVDPTRGRALVVLAGPGEANPAGVRAGQIRVANAGVERDVVRSGWGVEIPNAQAPPSPPFPVPQELYDSFRFETDAPPKSEAKSRTEAKTRTESKPKTGSEPRAESKPGAASEPSTEPERGGGDLEGTDTPELGAPEPTSSIDTAAGGTLTLASDGAEFDQRFTQTLGDIDGLNEDPAQLASIEMNSTQTMVELGATQTTIADLIAVDAMFNGHFIYNFPFLGFTQGLPGSGLDLTVDLDFSVGVVGIQVQNIQSSLLGLSMVNATGSPSFGGLTGDAKFLETLSCDTAPCQATVLLDFINEGAQIAARLKASVRVDQTSPSGSLETAVTDSLVSITP